MILQLEKAAANCADSGNESPENVLHWFLSCHKTDFTTIKQFLTPCCKLFTTLRTYMIPFPVLFDETQFQTIWVKALRDTCQILGRKVENLLYMLPSLYEQRLFFFRCLFLGPPFPPDNVETCQRWMNGS